jgi:hypothetical protein
MSGQITTKSVNRNRLYSMEKGTLKPHHTISNARVEPKTGISGNLYLFATSYFGLAFIHCETCKS